MKYLILLLISCIALTSCATVPQCSPEEYRATVLPLLEEWDDAVNTAKQTPRMSLPSMISELQSIRRRTQNLEIEECFEDAHSSYLILYMGCTIEGFLAFLGQDDSKQEYWFNLAEAYLEGYQTRLKSATE